MPEFIPPHPPPLPHAPTWRRIMMGRLNFLEMWDEEAFVYEFSAGRLFIRRVFVYMGPNSVQCAISHKNASFARKSTQMRYALFAVIPFSIGPRICAGMSFGQQEASLWPPKPRTAAGQDYRQVGWPLGHD